MVVEAVRIERRTQALARRRRDDLWIGVTSLVASMLALPLDGASGNCPDGPVFNSCVDLPACF